MTPHIAITLGVIVAALGMFVWNRVPAAAVAVCASLALFFTGVISAPQMLTGFGDPVVILLVALFTIAVALEEAGVAAWAGQLLMRYTARSPLLRLVAIMVVAAVFSALMGMNGAVAAMIPIVVVVALRTHTPASKLMLPLALACLTGAKLTLLGTPVNVLAATQAEEAGAGQIGFFGWALVGIPQLVGTIVITVLFARLIPDRPSPSLPADLSSHADTLGAEYRLEDLALTRDLGLAEVVVPSRSPMIGEQVFAGMSDADGGVVIAAVKRGDEVAHAPLRLRAGDHLLVEGSWGALDGYLESPAVLPVDKPGTVKRQAVALGRGAPQAIGILALLVVLLAFNIVPATVAAVVCAVLMVLTRVVTPPQVFHGVDWNSCILIGAMIPPAVAMTHTGAAALIGDGVVDALGSWGPYAVLAGLFLVSAVITQFISNTSTALVMLPIGLATAGELGVSPLPMMIAVAMGASASFLTPFSNGVSMMAFGPGGYRFGDFWKIGLIVLAWTMLVTVALVPVFWRF